MSFGAGKTAGLSVRLNVDLAHERQFAAHKLEMEQVSGFQLEDAFASGDQWSSFWFKLSNDWQDDSGWPAFVTEMLIGWRVFEAYFDFGELQRPNLPTCVCACLHCSLATAELASVEP